jgi:hypothetical protein
VIASENRSTIGGDRDVGGGTDQLEELRNESHVVEQVTLVDLELGDVLRLATSSQKIR